MYMVCPCVDPSVGTVAEVDVLHGRPVERHQDLPDHVVAQFVRVAQPGLEITFLAALDEVLPSGAVA